MSKTNLEVARHWVAQDRAEARSGNGNMSLAGATLYSYSTPIGHLVRDTEGRLVPLLTAHSYSVTTTGKHMSAAHRATDYKAFVVPFFGIGRIGRHRIDTLDMQEAHVNNMAYYASRYAEEVRRLQRARVYKDSTWLDRIAEEAKRYAATFGIEEAARPYLRAMGV